MPKKSKKHVLRRKRPFRLRFSPVEQSEPAETTYKYVLPQDDQEVIVSAAAMALLDLVKQPLIGGREHVEARAHYHCEQAHQHSREPLTNDYESWKRLFIPNYVVVYQHAADRIDLDKMRAIADRHDLLTVLSEFRNIVKMAFFPDLADLSRSVLEREGIRLTPHRAASGYYVSFEYQGEIRRTPVKETPRDAFKEAERLIEGLNDDEDLQGQQ